MAAKTLGGFFRLQIKKIFLKKKSYLQWSTENVSFSLLYNKTSR